TAKATKRSTFRAQNSHEHFDFGNQSNTPNPSLRAARIRTWELYLEHRFGKTFYASGAGFLNRMNVLIVQGIDPATGRPVYTNSSPVQTKGMELELGARWPGGMEGTISHSLQDSRNVVTRDLDRKSTR